MLVFKPTTHLPQDLCTCSSLCLELPPPRSPIPHYPLQASALLMLSTHPLMPFPLTVCGSLFSLVLWGVCLPHLSSRKGEPQALIRCEGQRGSPMQQEEVAAPGSLGSWAGLHPSVKPVEEASALTQASGMKW